MPSSLRRTAVPAAVVAIAGLLASGCAAGGDGGDGDRPLVLTTFTVLADMTREVGGDRIEVESITDVGAEIHGYEPTPSDLRAASRADLVLDNGLGLEGWFERFLAEADAPRAVVSDGVEPIPIASGEDGGAPNPHAWMSPTNGVAYAENIRDALIELDPAGEREYRENAAAYAERIEAVGADMRAEIDRLDDDARLLVTCEGAFSYLAEDAGLDEAYIWPVNAEREATPQRIAAAIEAVRERDVPAVFCESTVSDRAMRQVAEATGAALAGPLYVDSLSEADGPVPSYLALLEHDAAVIVDALAGRP